MVCIRIYAYNIFNIYQYTRPNILPNQWQYRPDTLSHRSGCQRQRSASRTLSKCLSVKIYIIINKNVNKNKKKMHLYIKNKQIFATRLVVLTTGCVELIGTFVWAFCLGVHEMTVCPSGLDCSLLGVGFTYTTFTCYLFAVNPALYTRFVRTVNVCNMG